MSPSVRSSLRADGSERPADTEENYDNRNFFGGRAGIDRR